MDTYGQKECSQVGTIIIGNRKIVIYIIIGRDHSAQERKVIESIDCSITHLLTAKRLKIGGKLPVD
jgi:hypothetical protein